MVLRHDDKSLPLIIRNILARDHYDARQGIPTKEQKNEQLLECYLAMAFEKMCPFWGGALPYDGRRGSGVASIVEPKFYFYRARYNLFMNGDLVKDNSRSLADFEDLIGCMVSEFIYELAPMFEGKNKKLYPLITARPMYQLDIATMEKSVRFQAIFYAAKPFEFDLSKSPDVPVTEPRPGFCGHLMQFPTLF